MSAGTNRSPEVLLVEGLKKQARQLGFDAVGIAPATPADDFPQFLAWLDRGHAGDMAYLRRHGEARRHPASILSDVRSVVMVLLNYRCPDGRAEQSTDCSQEAKHPPRAARVARYALGRDYHDVLREKLNSLLAWIQQQRPQTRGRGVVDTAPLLERDFARRAGLGWVGKNTMLINPRLGSFTFLGALLLDLELPTDEPFVRQHCGTCTACLDACPTQAFVGPYQLDARRCISYLTIELRGTIPENLRAGVGDWLFGCDVCQDVCPWNRKAPWGQASELAPRAEIADLDPIELLDLSEDEFRRRFRGTALWRAKRRGLVRNAIVVVANRGDAKAAPFLKRASEDSDPVVRETARWALARLCAHAPSRFFDFA
ncbi:MAG: tRNA epoxyqueuosine(34) reductase QueG [Gemmataceae bacterium]|nr:tRNA epoxyqueuosine(34) reductase QueG [Gemmataceae bacterium]